MTSLERNQKAVVDFHDLMFKKCRTVEAVRRFVGASYTQNNPQAADGK